MKIIEPSANLVGEINGTDILRKIERCGRVCYKSESNITDSSAEKFVRMIIKRGHESVLEHELLTFHIVCDRGVLAELTRHRLASFSVESTRYNNYDELTFIEPCYWTNDIFASAYWKDAMIYAEQQYLRLRRSGATPEQARAVLPLSLATDLYMTANLREYRHILKLRTDKGAHPQMRQIAGQILDTFKEKLPVLVEDIKP